MRWAIAIIMAVFSAAPADASDLLGQAAGAALQADARRALELLKDVDPAALADKDRQFVLCMRERFGNEPASDGSEAAGSAFSDQVLAAYRDYWRSAMLRPNQRAQEEERLESRLRTMLRAPAGAQIDELEPLLADALKKEGLYSLQGRTGLLRELMIWSRQDSRSVPVVLPEGSEEVKVTYLDGFKSLGWGYYAACGRRGAGGWATPEALFAIVPRYESLDGEEFRVSFLGHEAQHFADMRRFKGIKPWELEYRAKLTELAQADATRAKILRKLIEDQGDDPASPHSFANRRLLTALVRELQLGGVEEIRTVAGPRLRETALKLLREDSRRRALAPKAS